MSAASRQHTCSGCGGAIDLTRPDTWGVELIVDDVIRAIAIHVTCHTHPLHKGGENTAPSEEH